MLTGRLDMHDTGILGFLYLEERFLARSLSNHDTLRRLVLLKHFSNHI